MHHKGKKNRRCNSAMGSKTYHRHDHGKRGHKAPLAGARVVDPNAQVRQQAMKHAAE